MLNQIYVFQKLYALRMVKSMTVAVTAHAHTKDESTK